jgi:mono/diheme cytochrome c family protein
LVLRAASAIISAVLLTFAFMAGLAAQPLPTTIPEMWDAWCARCHAKDGSGKVAEPTITVEAMDFTDCKVATPEPDADWELAIAAGGPAVGLSAEMPAFGDTLSADQVRGFIAHIRGFCGETGWPHGNANFPRPIFTEKAYPENELVILPIVAHRRPDVVVATGGTRVPADPSLTDLNVLAVYERRFGKRTMWEVAVPLASHDTAGLARRQGIGDIEVAIKHVIAARADAPRILSAGLEVSLPTGSAVRGLGRGRTMLEPYLAAGALVANTYLQGQSKLELPADGARTGRAVVYNIYAGRDTSKAPDTWTLGLELNGENRELALTPQVRKGLTKTGALGAALGVRFPITQRRVQGTRVVSYVLWEYLEPVKARR